MALYEEPTAKQAVVHDTPDRLADAAFVTIVHVLPTRRSVNVLLPVGVNELPTATQLVALGHETSDKEFEYEGMVFGLATIAHPDPFQRSVKVRVAVVS